MKTVAHRPQDLQDIRVIVTSNPKLDVRRIRREVRGMASALDMPERWEDMRGSFKDQDLTQVGSDQNREKVGKRRNRLGTGSPMIRMKC